MPAFHVPADVEDDADEGVVVDPARDLLGGQFLLGDAGLLVDREAVDLYDEDAAVEDGPRGLGDALALALLAVEVAQLLHRLQPQLLGVGNGVHVGALLSLRLALAAPAVQVLLQLDLE